MPGTDEQCLGTVGVTCSQMYPPLMFIVHNNKDCSSLLIPVSRLHETTTLLAIAKFLELSGALMSNGKPYKKLEMPLFLLEVDTSHITDDELSTTLPKVPPILLSPYN